MKCSNLQRYKVEVASVHGLRKCITPGHFFLPFIFVSTPTSYSSSSSSLTSLYRQKRWRWRFNSLLSKHGCFQRLFLLFFLLFVCSPLCCIMLCYVCNHCWCAFKSWPPHCAWYKTSCKHNAHVVTVHLCTQVKCRFRSKGSKNGTISSQIGSFCGVVWYVNLLHVSPRGNPTGWSHLSLIAQDRCSSCLVWLYCCVFSTVRTWHVPTHFNDM